jgi:hypothetical protein
MAILEDLIPPLATLILNIIIISPILWLAGRGLVGKEKAKFTDAIWITTLGTLIGFAFNYISFNVFTVLGFIGTIIGAIIMLIVWLGLIKHFFDTGWGMAFVIAIIAVIIYIIVAFIIALILGLALLGAGLF